MSPFDPLALCQTYFDAWRRHDAQAICAALAPGGHYEDPLTGGPIRGDALCGYVQQLWSAFPDLDFELGSVHRVAEGCVHGAWTMVGTHGGSFHGLPPTGRSVRLNGLDVIDVGPAGVKHVLGYFDSAVVPRQLGLDVVVQPREIGPVHFGVSTVVRRDVPVQPGVLAFTELIARTDAHVHPIREMSRQTVIEQLGNPAFLGFTSAVAGRRMTTVSAWTSHEAMSTALHTGAHVAAMRAFYSDGLADSAYTSVYTRVRVGPYWRRCVECGAMTRLDQPRGHCSECHAPVEALA
jgi:steroid delta-isomerase-like uncharacterized protein